MLNAGRGPRKIEDPLEYPVQNGRRIAAGSGSVRDRERKDDHIPPPPGVAHDAGEPLRCGKCGRAIKKRSIKPGAVLCPRCRPDAVMSVIIYRGTEAPTTPEPGRSSTPQRSQRPGKAGSLL